MLCLIIQRCFTVVGLYFKTIKTTFLFLISIRFYQITSSHVNKEKLLKLKSKVVFIVLKFKYIRRRLYLKFGDGDGPNLCRVKKVDVSSTFIENILTLVSFNDIITIHIEVIIFSNSFTNCTDRVSHFQWSIFILNKAFFHFNRNTRLQICFSNLFSEEGDWVSLKHLVITSQIKTPVV